MERLEGNILSAALEVNSGRVYRRETYEMFNGVLACTHVHCTCVQLAPSPACQGRAMQRMLISWSTLDRMRMHDLVHLLLASSGARHPAVHAYTGAQSSRQVSRSLGYEPT